MMRTKEIDQEIRELGLMQALTEVYAEVASNRMRKTRTDVLKNRDFLEAINLIFEEVRASYVNELNQLIKHKRFKKGQRITLLSHNGKRVAVFLSANTGLYGDVVQNTFNLFLEEVRSQGSEATIVGRLGLSLFQESEPNKPYTYFEMPDYGIASDHITKIIRHVVKYEEIHVYFGKFQSVVSQLPAMFNISSQLDVSKKPESADHKNYIFEPSLEKILMFFEAEIFASLFEQAVRESQLAKLGSRILAMDKAYQNIEEYIKKVELIRMALVHRQLNRKQLNEITHLIAYHK